MKTTVAFAALRSRHQNESNATKRFVVRSVNKSGALSKARLTTIDWQLNAFATEPEADARRAQLETLNPGSRFAVTPA